MKLARLQWVLVPAAALLAVLPLILGGVSCGHDFHFHLENWMTAQQQWSHGVALPRWDFLAAWGAGEPRLIFYPPLSWMLGGLLGVFLPWGGVPIAFTWVALMLNGATLYRLARTYVARPVAVAAACLYLVNPYMLFTAYERTAYGELLAAAWMPWLLMEALRPRIRIVTLAIPVALLWLTNAPAAVIGCYSLLFIGVVRLLLLLLHSHRIEARKMAIAGVGGTALGLALAGFYLVPVLYERHLVQIRKVIVDGMRPWDNFLFAHTGDAIHDAVLRTASTATILVVLAAMIAAVIVLLRRKDASARHAAVLFLLSGAILFLLLPPSIFVWKHLPQLDYLQFPWRFAAIEGAIAATLIAMALRGAEKERMALTVGTIVLLCVCLFGAIDNFRQYCDEEDVVSAERAAFLQQRGNWPTEEYTPKSADNSAQARDNPPFWLAQTAGATPGALSAANVIAVQTGNPYHFGYQVASGAAPFLVLNLRAFYGWHIFVNSHDVPLASRADGLMAVALPQGQPTYVEVSYRTTPDQYAGIGLSFFAVLVVLGFYPARRRAAA